MRRLRRFRVCLEGSRNGREGYIPLCCLLRAHDVAAAAETQRVRCFGAAAAEAPARGTGGADARPLVQEASGASQAREEEKCERMSVVLVLFGSSVSTPSRLAPHRPIPRRRPPRLQGRIQVGRRGLPEVRLQENVDPAYLQENGAERWEVVPRVRSAQVLVLRVGGAGQARRGAGGPAAAAPLNPSRRRRSGGAPMNVLRLCTLIAWSGGIKGIAQA